MAKNKKMTDDEIEAYIKSKQVSSEDYKAPTVKVGGLREPYTTTDNTVTRINPNTSNMVSKPKVTVTETLTMPGFTTKQQADKNYQDKLSIFNRASEDYDKKRIEELNKKNIDLTRKLDYQDFKNNIKDGVVNKKSVWEKEREYEAFEPELDKLTEQERQAKSAAKNDLKLAKYQKNVAEVEDEDVGLLDQITSPFLSGIGDVFSTLTDDNRYTDPVSGETMYLPSKNDLKYQKVRDSYGDGFLGNLARFGGDVTHELGKQAGTQALNAVTGGKGGSALYFSDIVADQYKQNINEGYDQTKSLGDAITKGASNYIKQKIIGGLGGKLTGGDASWLENKLTDTFSKAVSNPRVLSTLTSLGSEALDEFTDTYVEAGIDAAILGKDFKADELFLDALYSGAIGGATGAANGFVNVSPEARQAILNKQQTNQNVETKPQNNNSLESQLERQGAKILEETNRDIDSAKQIIEDYLEDSGITNPTKQDMMNAFGWYDEYDAALDMSDLQRAERIYGYAADELLQEKYNKPTTQTETPNLDIKPQENINTQTYTQQTQNDLKSGNNEEITVKTPNVRTDEDISSRKVNAYQYDNPAVKPFYKDAALDLQDALYNYTTKGERTMRPDGTWTGTKFSSTPEITELHQDYKMSYDDIKRGLNGIIKDEGEENNSASKKIEVVIDKMLKEGYRSQFDELTNKPNQEYIDTLAGKLNQQEDNDLSWIDEAEENYKRKLQENLAERKNDDVLTIKDETNNIVNKFNEAKKGDVFSKVEQEQGRPIRQGIKTITTATGTTQLVSDMDGSVITYEPLSNQKTLDAARQRSKDKSLKQRYKENLDFIKSDKRVTADRIADIDTLLVDLQKNFNNSENIDMFLDLAQQAATLRTTDAQALQFMGVIKKLNPETQLDTLIKLVNNSQQKGEKTFEGVELNNDLVQKALESKDNKVEFDKAMDNLLDDIAQQMHVGFLERLNAFRFLSMLGNFKTHLRNMLGNGAMYEMQSFKDTLGSIGESGYDTVAKALGGKGLKERTKATFGSLRASKEVRNFVNNKVDQFFETQDNNSKYNESKNGMLNKIKSKRKMFTEVTPIGKALNKLATLNGRALDIEDKWFSNAMTKKAMKSFLVANGIKTNADIEAHPELIGRALDYAVFKGQEATYHQDSKTATAINNLKETLKTGSGFSKLGGLAVEATMPFVKTPVNIAKTSLEYTPLLGTLDLNTQLKNAPQELKGAVIIDNISKQFTGLALLGVGMALANSGVIKIKGSGEGDKEDEIESDLGYSNYTINTGKDTYDLSWLAPTAVPLFEGVELFNKFGKDKDVDVNNLIDTLFGALDPVTDMSVLQSFERLITALSTGQGNLIKEAGSQTFSSYLSQYIPTLLSQLAQTTDEDKRDTNTSNSVLGKTWDSIKYKIPGLRQTLPESVDIWGETNKNASDVLQRALESFFSPANRKDYKVDDTTRALEELARETGNTGVLPTKRNKSITINKEKVKLEGKEFTDYKKAYGKTAKKQIDDLLNSEEYKNADDEVKEKMIRSLYDYAIYKANKQYADNNGIDYKNSSGNKYALVDAFDVPYYELEGMRLTDLSKKDEKQEAINQTDLTDEQKDIINLIQNYKYYDADVDSLINKINNSNLSKSQKEQLIAKIKKNSTKGGK